MSSSAAHRVARAAPIFPDEILEEIFLRLDAAADVARASAACTTFRRVVSARRFRLRFRSLHPPPILGFLDLESHAPGAFHPAEPPHGSASAARALSQAADFSFSFIDAPDSWRVCDARNGRVLLYRRVNTTAANADLMVCDPLHRRHVLLPPIPDDLAAATDGRGSQELHPFLDPATDKDEEELFRVICVVQRTHKLVTFHFSSVTWKWRDVTFDRTTPLCNLMATWLGLFERHYAHGCFYWMMYPSMESLFILNPREMKFSVIDCPPIDSDDDQHVVIVELGRGRLGLVNLCNGVGSEEWQHEKTIQLPDGLGYSYTFSAVGGGYLVLQAVPLPQQSAEPADHVPRMPEIRYFTLNIRTLLVERLCASNRRINSGLLYANFLPPLSLPSV